MAGKARRRRPKARSIARRIALVPLAIIGAYLIAALVGSLIPVNRAWVEPDEGVTIYLADNGVHSDIVMPLEAEGLDWSRIVPRTDMQNPPIGARYVAFGMGEQRVYLETPRWRDIRPGTIWSALAGGKRVMHVEWVADPRYSAREVRLTPEQYRRLWAAVRAGFALDSNGKPVRLDHPGYGPGDAFYTGVGKANAFDTCNQWSASRLRLAGVRTSLWAPFVQGLVWRYRAADQRT